MPVCARFSGPPSRQRESCSPWADDARSRCLRADDTSSRCLRVDDVNPCSRHASSANSRNLRVGGPNPRDCEQTTPPMPPGGRGESAQPARSARLQAKRGPRLNRRGIERPERLEPRLDANLGKIGPLRPIFRRFGTILEPGRRGPLSRPGETPKVRGGRPREASRRRAFRAKPRVFRPRRPIFSKEAPAAKPFGALRKPRPADERVRRAASPASAPTGP